MTPTDERPSGGCRKIILIALAALLVILLPVTILLFNIGRVVFSPTIVKRVTHQTVEQTDIVPLGLEWFSEWRAQQRVDVGLARPNDTEPDVVQMLSFMTLDDWTQARDLVLPNEILFPWADASIDGVYAWIDTTDTLPQITLDMRAFKALVNTDAGDQALMVNYNALPVPCTQAQIDDFQQRFAEAPPGKNVLYNLCQFPDPWKEDQISDYHDSLIDVVNNIPDDYPLVSRINESGYSLFEGIAPERVKNTLKLIRFVMRWALVLPLLVAVILFFLATDTPKRAAWMGVPLIVGGGLAALLGVLERWAITYALLRVPLETVPQAVLDEAKFFFLRLGDAVFWLHMAMSLIVVGLGIVALFLLQRRQEAEETLADEAAGLEGG